MTTERAVHPAAAIFPMLADDELRELAEDIKANGLIHPIKIDKDGAIVDGRNRDAACRMAGVEPSYETLNGQDPVAFILSANIHRRHMNKGQRAIAGARVRLLNNRSMSQIAGEAGTSKASVAQATIVLDYAPDLADIVLSGAMFLADAYTKARARKIEQETQAEADARALAETTAKTAELREHAPDLAELVAEWRLSLDDAMGALRERREDERREQRSATALFVTVLDFLAPPSGSLAAHAAVTATRIKLGTAPGSERISAERIDRARQFLDELRPSIERQEQEAKHGRGQSA